mgnify:CR=1 FL=1
MIGNVVAALIGLAVGGVICFFLGIRYRKTVSEKEISSAEEEGKRIINEAIKSAETKKKEALLEAKEEILKNRSEYEKEVNAGLTCSGRKTACSRRKRTSTARPRLWRRERSPWPRSMRPSTRKTRRSKSSSAARRRCWSGFPASPPRRPRPI